MHTLVKVTVNADYIVGALKQFFKRMKQKRLQMVDKGFILHWDNAPVHTTNVVTDFLASKEGVQVLRHPPYSPDLAPCDFFLFPKMKNKLAGESMSSETFHKMWFGVTATLIKDDFTAAYQKWLERQLKCIRVGGSFVEKS